MQQVESENQKLKSLIGTSGEHEGYLNGSDQDDAQYGPRVVARLQDELKALRGKVCLYHKWNLFSFL